MEVNITLPWPEVFSHSPQMRGLASYQEAARLTDVQVTLLYHLLAESLELKMNLYINPSDIQNSIREEAYLKARVDLLKEQLKYNQLSRANINIETAKLLADDADKGENT